MTISTLVFIIISFRSLVEVTWAGLPSSAWLSIFYSGILPWQQETSFGYGVLEKSAGTSTAVFTNVTPIFAILTGCIVLKESFGLIQIIGAVIIFYRFNHYPKSSKSSYGTGRKNSFRFFIMLLIL